jgi:hypothetical protein
MPRLTADQWETVRAEREAGSGFRELATRWGVSHQAIQKRSSVEGWNDGQDVGAAVRRKVAEKVAGVVATANPKKKAEAIDAAANRVAQIVTLHQQEWADHREQFGSVPEHFEAGKLAKISAEMLRIRQDGERRAHGLDNDTARTDVTVKWEGLE